MEENTFIYVDEEILHDSPFDKLRIKLHAPFLLPRTIPLSSINQILIICLPTHPSHSYYNNQERRDCCDKWSLCRFCSFSHY